MVDFSITFDKSHAKNLLNEIKKNIENLEKTHSEVAEFVNKLTEEHFDKTLGDNGTWKPRLSTKYNHPLLNKTGKLKESVTSMKNVKIQDNLITFSSDVIYSFVHQFGSEKKNIVARVFTWLSQDDLKKIEEIYLSGILKDASSS